MRQNEVKTYYTELGEKEWLRLTNLGDGAVEFAVTTFTIASYLPPSGQILDIGGGPGRYAIWLAEQGHKVVLADLSPTLLDIARTKIAEANLTDHINEIVEVDVCDLSRWPEDSFDAVVCLGPFYHLPDPIERKRATLELIRVLKPGGVAFVAFMPLFGFLRRTLALEDERHHLEKPEWQAQLLGKGLFINEIPGRFNHGFGIRPEEIAPYLIRQPTETRWE
jgi:S-adenosylmethionine-dependent methyltransferase